MKRQFIISVLSFIFVITCAFMLVGCGDSGKPTENTPKQTAEHTHEWSQNWGYNETHHWHNCTASDCPVTDNSQKDGYAEHDFSKGVCICGQKPTATEGLRYELNPDAQSYSVSGMMLVAETDIIIPSEYEGKPVTSLDNYAFYCCNKLQSITIPESITSIGDYAFYGCTKLTGVYITDIAAWCKISFGTNYANPLYADPRGYAHNLYLNNALVTDLVIPESITSIGDYAFSNCSSLTSVTIPDSITSIGDYAFYKCSSLKSVTIHNKVTSIGKSAFSDCFGLEDVYITDIEAWCKISFGDSYANPLRHAHNLYLNDTLVTDLVIPNSVTSIGDWAFMNFSGLEGVYITDIEAWCKISFGNSSANPLGGAHNLYLNDTLVTDLVIPNSITSIGDYAFNGCSSLTSVTIPNSVTSIGKSAFNVCSSLEKVYYNGTAEDWASIDIGSSNTYLTNATRYYYSEAEPTEEGNYWYYDGGNVVEW